MSQSNLFFTADLHVFHRNIIIYSKRPFSDIDHMNESLITNWNRVVPPEGIVYILGDVSFAKDQSQTQKVISRLNGQKHLIRGNHDEKLSDETLSRFSSVQYYAELMVPDIYSNGKSYKQLICLLHYPMLTWNGSHKGSWSLHGHCHSSLPEDTSALRLDVGVDCAYADYSPISYEVIKKLMAKKTCKPINHHGN